MEEETEKDGKKWSFTQIAFISRFTKNPDSYPANSLKRNTVSTSLEKKV